MYKLTKIVNKKPKKLLSATTKYIILLTIAILSSFISLFISLFLIIIFGNGHKMLQLGRILVNIDCVTNITCLYLQYPFNKHLYNKYCICFVNCCTCFLTKDEINMIEENTATTMEMGVTSQSQTDTTTMGTISTSPQSNKSEEFSAENTAPSTPADDDHNDEEEEVP